MKDVHKKLSLAPKLQPAIRPPMPWRQKLSGLQLGNVDAGPKPDDSTPKSTTDYSSFTPPWIIPSDITKEWHKPGVFGIDRDEGKPPDLNNPDLISLCEM
jgi:hypothetical protein